MRLVKWICLCVSNSILNEYEEIIEKLVDVQTAKFVINVILNNPFVVFVNPSFEFNLIVADPDDNKFVDVSIAANAKVIVTDDKHFKVLESIKFPLVLTIRLEDFFQYSLRRN